MKRNWFESHNPVVKDSTFRETDHSVLDAEMVGQRAQGMSMTEAGAVNKSFILGGLMLFASLIGFAYANPVFMIGGAIGGLVIVLITVFKKHLSPTLAPIYAGLEGLFVGSITAIYASAFSGIVFHAVTLTMALFFIMLFIYKAQIIRVTDKFRVGIVMATGAVMVLYLVNFVLSFFGMNIPFLHEGGVMGIGISLVIIGIASMNLLLDFDNFKKGEQFALPKYMEWFFAMSLIITLVWLYLEILRLLSILGGDD